MSNSQATFASLDRSLYDPSSVLKHPDFRILADDEKSIRDENVNLACFYNDKKQVHLVEKPKPKPGPGQVLVHVKATGICGSDVHFWQHSRIGPTMVVKDECGAGHESAGEVIEVGEGVEKFKPGDRVAIEAGIPCSKPTCDMCRIGKYNACPEVIFLSTPPYHGLLTRYHVHPAAWLHPLPSSLSYEEGSLLEPLCVALAGLSRSQLSLGDPLLICGAGPIGLISLLAARAAGAAPIVITDLDKGRLEFAERLVKGVRTVVVQRGEEPKEVAEKVKEKMGMQPVVALECTGVESSVSTAIYSLRFGGTCFVIGVGKEFQNIPFMHLSAYEIDLRYQYRYANQYPKAIRLVSEGLIDLKPLVTHRFPLEKAVEAFHTAADMSSGCIKVQITD